MSPTAAETSGEGLDPQCGKVTFRAVREVCRPQSVEHAARASSTVSCISDAEVRHRLEAADGRPNWRRTLAYSTVICRTCLAAPSASAAHAMIMSSISAFDGKTVSHGDEVGPEHRRSKPGSSSCSCRFL